MPYIHFNIPLSAKKGFKGGFNRMRELADATSQELYLGNEGHYGSDYMSAPKDPEELEILKGFLEENNVHWAMVDDLPYNMRWMVN